MLSQTAEHALRAVLYLARNAEDAPISAEAIAEALGAPANYMAKTLRGLAEAGVVVGVRGPNGGYRLAHSADEVRLSEVIEAFDRPWYPVTCLLGDRPCDAGNPCDAHHCWSSMARRVREPLRTTSVSDLLNGRCGAHALETDPTYQTKRNHP